MDLVISITLMILGLIIFYITYKDGKEKKMGLTTSYVMHLKGYIGAIGVFLIGLILLFK